MPKITSAWALAGTSVALAVALAGGFAQADDRVRQGEVRELREAGKILPMEEILGRVRSAQPGQIVEIELDREQGRYVYEVKLIDDADAIHKIELDASTGEIVQRRRK